MKLQMQSLELNNTLEELSTQAISSMPHALREAERLRKEAASLKERMCIFNESLHKVESYS